MRTHSNGPPSGTNHLGLSAKYSIPTIRACDAVEIMDPHHGRGSTSS
jgi:hypothetical protein